MCGHSKNSIVTWPLKQIDLFKHLNFRCFYHFESQHCADTSSSYKCSLSLPLNLGEHVFMILGGDWIHVLISRGCLNNIEIDSIIIIDDFLIIIDGIVIDGCFIDSKSCLNTNRLHVVTINVAKRCWYFFLHSDETRNNCFLLTMHHEIWFISFCAIETASHWLDLQCIIFIIFDW